MKYTRKEFLKLSTLAGAGLLLGSHTTFANNFASDEHFAPFPEPSDSPDSIEWIRKDDTRYDLLRKGFNKRIDLHPQVIALCSSTQDVVEAVQYAKANNLPVAVKSGGHSMEGFSCNEGGLVVNLSKMNSVAFLEDNKIKVGPGCILSNLYNKVLPKKRIIPAGSCGTVGIGGVTTGGGYGLFSRKYGLACDSLLEATMVDGNGNIHSTKDNPELLWAIRGGGAGNFGIVTELIFKTYTAPATMRSYHFKSRKLDGKRAAKLLEKWFEFSASLPDSCFSGFVLNGSTLNVLVTNFEKHTPELQKALDKFALVNDKFTMVKPVNLADKLKKYYGSEVPLYFKNSSAGLYKNYEEIAGFITEALNKVIHTPGMIYQVNTLGGKIADAEAEKASCYPHRAYNFIAELQAYWQLPTQETKLKKVSEEILSLFDKNGIKAQYFNYCSTAFNNWETAYYGDNYPRLQAIKRLYDPENIIRHPQSVRG